MATNPPLDWKEPERLIYVIKLLDIKKTDGENKWRTPAKSTLNNWS